MINAVIIDDEEKGRKYLTRLISEVCPHVNLVGTADSLNSGIELISSHSPDLVFLDIQMPGGTGFDLLEKLEEIGFDIIFTTAHDEFAIRAIKFSALDYLLKPVDPDELADAVEKVNKKRNNTINEKKLEFFFSNVYSGRLMKQIALPMIDGLIFVEIDQIIRCEGEGAYTVVYVKGKNKILISKNLLEIEQLLKDYGFFRVHKSHLINLNEVRKYTKGDGGYIVMSNGDQVNIARRRKEIFLKVFNN